MLAAIKRLLKNDSWKHIPHGPDKAVKRVFDHKFYPPIVTGLKTQEGNHVGADDQTHAALNPEKSGRAVQQAQRIYPMPR